MKHYLSLFCLTFCIQVTHGYTPQVPARIRFADIRLHLSKAARKRVQEKVDSLTQSSQCFQDLLDRVSLFLPIVERVLKEESLPLDFKYLVIQESGFVSDAVSTSNAVGFWQFKEPTAKEVGLKINQYVDERMHIAAATRAAAKYIKQNNQEFNNWLHALLAYCEGRGGARKLIAKRYMGAKSMKIEQEEHMYIIHLLACKVAFEQVLAKTWRPPQLHLYEYQDVRGKTLNEISNYLGVDNKKVQDYNKWLKRYRVPHDTTCTAIIPMTHKQYARRIASSRTSNSSKSTLDYTKYCERYNAFPVVSRRKHKKNATEVTLVNKIVGVVAIDGDSLVSLSKAGNISLSRFLMFNDLERKHLVVPGQVYYYKSKKSKANVYFHIVQPGETWWSIAQKYGIKKKMLLLKNRLRRVESLQPGRVLWLRCIRPSHTPVAYEPLHQASD